MEPTYICGIDEAGRGPVIGPMVIAGVLIDKEDEPKLKAIGAKDSKLLTPYEREQMFEGIKKIAKDHVILIIQASEIDDAVRGIDGLNLNRLEAKKTAQILNSLKPDIAYVDSPSTNLSAYSSLIQSQLTIKTKLICEHKADANYLSAAAASILAKVTRDREIERIKKEIGIDIGSGYPSDPKTVSFLDKHYLSHANLFRKSWSSYTNRANRKFQSTLEGFSQSIKKQDANPEMAEKLRTLEPLGYSIVPTTSEHEQMRLKGECTVTLYTNGKVLIQGNQKVKEKILEFLGISQE